MSKKHLILTAVVLCVGQLAFAAGVWTGGGADTNWSTEENWNTGLPASGDDVEFATGDPLPATAVLNGNRTVGYLTFSADNDFTISGTSTLTVNSGINVTALNAHTYNMPAVSMGGSNVWTVGLNQVVRVNGMLSGYQDLRVTGGGTVRMGDKFNFNRSLTIDDMTTLIMGGSYSYVDSLNVAGTLQFGDGGTKRLWVVGSQDGTVTGSLLRDTSISAIYPQLFYFGTGTTTYSGEGNSNTVGDNFVGGGGSTLVLDNSEGNRVGGQRLGSGTFGSIGGVGTLRILGNDTALTEERVANLAMRGGLLKLDLTHGEGADLLLRFNRDVNAFSQRGGMLSITANDLGATTGFKTRIYSQYNDMQNYSHFPSGTSADAAKGILPGWLMIGYEFGRYNNASTVQSIVPYSGPRTTLIGSGTDTVENVLLSDSETLTVDRTINSLKIDSELDLNLGSKTLTVTRGGIIRSGTTGTSAISNGTLIAGYTSNSTKYLYLNNEGDMAISANVTADGIAKMGPGKLTFSGNISAATPYMRWYEGSLEWLSNSNVTIQNGISGDGSLVKDGTGKMTLLVLPDTTAGDNYYHYNYTGGTTVKSGILQFGPDAGTDAIGTIGTEVRLEGGTLKLTSRYGGRANTITMAGGTLDFGGYRKNIVDAQTTLHFEAGTTSTLDSTRCNDAWGSYVYKLTGSGTLRKVGADTISTDGYYQGVWLRDTNSTFSGAIQIDQGRVKVENAGYWPADVARVAIASGAQLILPLTITVDDTFTGSGKVSMGSYGTTYDGTMTSAGATFKPAGILTVQGNLTFSTTGGTIEIDIIGSGAVAGVDFDQLAVKSNHLTGLNSLTGLANASLVVNVASGLDLAGDVLTVISTHNDLSLDTLGSITINGGAMLADVTYGLGGVSLSNFRNAVVIKMGDADGDTFVDDDDLSLLLSNWKGGNVGWSKGDFNASGDVDDDDLSLLLSNWTGSGGGTIPEPATMALLILGGIGLISRKRRHQA